MSYKSTQNTIDESTCNDTDEYGYTDLMRAVENNDIKKVKQFLEIKGIELEIMTDDSEYPEYGHTALSIATYKNNYEIFKLLLQKGANKNTWELKEEYKQTNGTSESKKSAALASINERKKDDTKDDFMDDEEDLDDSDLSDDDDDDMIETM
jgi:ankyrin repeat protein